MTNESFAIKKIHISRIIHETAVAKTFVLEFDEGQQPAYRSGQFLTLVFFTKHGEKRRSYSISSSPVLNEPLSITIKKVENGEFSRMLLIHAKAGDILFTAGISGLFLLPEKAQEVEQYFFIAAGSGITPCFSMIKTLLFTTASKIVLIYSNKTEADCIFLTALQQLQQAHPLRVKIRFLFSNIFNVYHSRLSKWLLLQLLDEHLISDPAKTRFYLCGPFEYMRMATITLAERIPPENILKENFNTLPRLLITRPPDMEAHTVKLHINGAIYTLHVQYPLTILAAAKLNKINVPYSCEAGRCGSCTATCISGKVWMAYNEVLMDDEIKKGRVLTCQGYPIGGDVEIVYT